jgi:hypothetical protein
MREFQPVILIGILNSLEEAPLSARGSPISLNPRWPSSSHRLVDLP